MGYMKLKKPNLCFDICPLPSKHANAFVSSEKCWKLRIDRGRGLSEFVDGYLSLRRFRDVL